jgi:ABC-type Fe3+-hydroxamate transport system substrate-binding protein
VWFVQRNSLHGAALRAAGGRNAVARDVTGTPRMSLEQLLLVDPDLIIVLDTSTRAAPSMQHGLLEALRAIGELSAVREQRTGVLRAASVHAIGPRILELIEPLAALIRRLSP